MKTTITPEEIASIKAALAKLYVGTFDCKSCDAKHNAQRNLEGRTHYVDDGTLRFHHSRVTQAFDMLDGLFFSVTTSDALDMRNSKRGFRCVVFDVFGEAVYRPDLEDAVSTSAKAEKLRDAFEFDVLAYYRGAIAGRVQMARNELERAEGALTLLETPVLA